MAFAPRRLVLVGIAVSVLLAACGRLPYVAPDDLTSYYISEPEQEFLERALGVAVTEDPATLGTEYHRAAIVALTDAEHACSRLKAGEYEGLANELDAEIALETRSAALRLERFAWAVELLCPKLNDDLQAFYTQFPDTIANARRDL